jgi:hypothetical protein
MGEEYNRTVKDFFSGLLLEISLLEILVGLYVIIKYIKTK